MTRVYVVTPAIERFERHYIPEPNSGCWLWTGAASKGRPMFCVSNQRVNTQAARFIWSHLHGPIPAGHFICHTCDTPFCVNPDHLFLGTPMDNVRDMMAKGRARFDAAGQIARARAATRAHCKKGHELTPENTDTRHGGRLCITCRRATTRIAVAKHYAKRQAERAERQARREIQRMERDPLPRSVREAAQVRRIWTPVSRGRGSCASRTGR